MKKVFIVFIFALMLISSISAEGIITINQQPKEIYNIGEIVQIQLTVTAPSESSVSDDIYLYLRCNGKPQIEICHNKVILNSEQQQESYVCKLHLTKDQIGEITGACKAKAYLSKQINDFKETNEFRISNIISVQPRIEQTEFEPGKYIMIEGTAIKENGQDANGFIDMEITLENSSENIFQAGTISNGFYSLNVSLPDNMKAGRYLVKLNAYEIDSSAIKTNTGFTNYNIAIKQVPRSLELSLENIEIEPGASMKVKAILHDQTGEKIASNAIISIKRGQTDIQQQTELPTDEFLEFPVAYNEPPSNWTVYAVSNQLTAESNFFIKEKKEIKVEMINETIKITNTGNVLYDDSVTIKIGNESVEFNTTLEIDGIQEYILRAPDGEYEIEVVDKTGNSKLRENVILTGRAIDIREVTKSGVINFIGRPAILIFIGAIILALIFIFLRKKFKDHPFWHINFKKKGKSPQVNTVWENRAIPLSKGSRLETKNKANLSLSIKGNKQEVSLVTLKIKNLGEIQSKKGNAEETLQKIVNAAENKKAFVYENQDNIFFILSPQKTRALKNEMSALEIAQTAKENLTEHNKIFKQKISFGISVEFGEIVESIKNGMLEFMSIGNLMTNAKRISSLAQDDVLLSEKIKEKLPSVRAERINNERVNAYKIKEIKYQDEEHSRFIKSFLKRAGEDKKARF